MKINFVGYANISKEDAIEQVRRTLVKEGIDPNTFPYDVWQDISYWGYEIALNCEFDTETEEVKIVGLKK